MNFVIEDKQHPLNDFERIAKYLMNENVLIINGVYYRFIDIEFYYFNEADKHADVYAHKHRLQKRSSHWYFHGSGLDITFGDGDTYGGILIRGLKNLHEDKFIDGPIKCVQELFSNFGKIDDPEKLTFHIQETGPDKTGSLIENQTVYNCRRVGINRTKDTSENARFYSAHYRFIIYPAAPHGEKFNIAEDLSKTLSKQVINDLFGYKYFKL